MKVSIITTLNHNVGDDFVRIGLKYLLKQALGRQNLDFHYIHKHSPISARVGFEWFRNTRVSLRVDKVIPLFLTNDRVLEADLVIQSGAPVYWCHDVGGSHCADNYWYGPLIKRRFLKNRKAKLGNIAIGTCQRYHSDGSEFCIRCKEYIGDFFNVAAVTTHRDNLSTKVLASIGLDAPVMPCSSIFAIDECGLQNEGNKQKYVVINYMKGGAHYTFGQNIDHKKWEREFSKFYHEIRNRERVVFSCHNRTEYEGAKRIDPDAEIFLSRDHLDFMKFYAKAKFGIVNRVHAAFLMASFGKPSIVIGNDTRARMAENIGLEHFFVNDADYGFLMSKYELLKGDADNYGARFHEIKDRAFSDYMEALAPLAQ